MEVGVPACAERTEHDSQTMVMISGEQAQSLARALSNVLTAARLSPTAPPADLKAIEALRHMLARAR
jgi:hypothetical protein